MRKTSLPWQLLVAMMILYSATGGDSLGSMSTIAASYGDAAIVCAVEASRGQQVLCWGATLATSVAQPFLALSGGNSFMCGLTADRLQPFCWRGNNTSQNLVPQVFQATRYQELAAGEDHVCAMRKTGATDCWRINGGSIVANPNVSLESIVAGRGFTCGIATKTKRVVCWGERSPGGFPPDELQFESLAAGRDHVCGIVSVARTVICWGETTADRPPPAGVAFAAITAGVSHSCGILNASHEVLCWGTTAAAGPQGAQFVALAASQNFTCGVRARNLLAACWGVGHALEPPLQLFSPGICARRDCSHPGEFVFNLSVIDSTQLPSICLQGVQQHRICLPCATSCPPRTFMSASCSPSLDRECTDCSMCKNSDPCQAVCGQNPAPSHVKVAIAAASAASVVICSAICFVVLLLRRKNHHHNDPFRCCCSFRKQDVDATTLMQFSSSCATSMSSPMICSTQAFRLAELRDATNGFKEANELGRGTYGSVYKAILPDGRKVAVKRANAARRIHCRSRDFEFELDVLCRVRHAQLVNLVGFCEEMGERILVYEFMANGTLHDHLHGGLTQLRSWALRFRIALQAARGIEYLHRDASPRILHKDIKSSNILLDGDWNARVADFGLSTNQIEPESAPRSSPIQHQSTIGPYTDPTLATSPGHFTEKSDVYSFGVVLLELLSGRRAYEKESSPPSIVDWARLAVREGATRTLLDPALEAPLKHAEPLLRVAEIAALCVRAAPEERPSLSDVVLWLELVGRGSFV